MSSVWLTLPLDSAAVQNLRIGEWVNLSGPLYTARDAALQRIHDLLLEGKQPPIDLKGRCIYFVGPTPPAPGESVGSAGPTTSRRMEPFLPLLLDAGVSGVIGKGPLSGHIVAEFQRRGVLYLSAAGGAGAYYGSKIYGAAVAAYEDLGPEAVYSIKVENFPAVVAVDLKGGDLFEEGPKAYRKE
ncbi:fumarate hydratase C-terminal domain-containing protein [candidate division FCPU426 bacterium]|nr:fumarate hydratase C-terminal domain-containing protein [candidate division FCPU426 bacterium]